MSDCIVRPQTESVELQLLLRNELKRQLTSFSVTPLKKGAAPECLPAHKYTVILTQPLIFNEASMSV